MTAKQLKKLIKSLSPEGKEIIRQFMELSPAAQDIAEKFFRRLCDIQQEKKE